MERSLDVRNWWVFVLRGVVAIAFGILTWVYPAMALLTLVLLFGAYALADGVSAFVAAVRTRPEAGERPRWHLVLYAVASVLAGLIALFAPGITALTLVFLIGARAIVVGALEIVAAVRLRKEIKGEWMLALGGAISIAFGVVLFLYPGAGALGLLMWIGAYAIVVGGLLIALGFRLRKLAPAGRPYAGTLASGH